MSVQMTRDMYSRVKRPRQQVKKDMYGIPIREEPEEEKEEEDTADETTETSDTDGKLLLKLFAMYRLINNRKYLMPKNCCRNCCFYSEENYPCSPCTL